MNRIGRLGAGLGPVLALWAVVPVLLGRSAPEAPWALPAFLAAAGALLHVGLRLLSNRWWFAGDRSPASLWVASVGVAAALSALLCALAVLGPPDRGVDPVMLAAAWFTMATLFLSAFRGRIEFRRWVRFHRGVNERTRPFATTGLGPDRATILDFVETLTEEADRRGSVGALEIRNAARWVQLSSDDRYRRAVPWSTARLLLASFLDHLERAGRARVTGEVSRGRDEVRVVLAPVCDAVQELCDHPAVSSVDVVSEQAPGAGLLLRISCSLVPERAAGPTIQAGTARALQPFGITVARPSADALVCTVTFSATVAERQDDDAIDAFLAAPATLISVSPFSGGSRSVYRRGNAVVKVQRHDRTDPKPTLLEDEFHLLRRLQGRSSRFPAAIGYGVESSFSWISYEYVDGEPLESWLDTHRSDATARLLSIGVDVQEMLEVLASCRVAHRDLNPGNMIVRPSGGVALIDFDQAASGPQFVGADEFGVDSGLAKNDVVEFLDKAGLTRAANEWAESLDRAWPSAGVPFSLGFLGRRFGQGWQLDPLLDAARRRLHPLLGARVLDLYPEAPIAGLLLASAGADVTAVVRNPERWQRLGSLVGPRFRMVTSPAQIEGSFDLTWAVGAPPSMVSDAGTGPVIVEWTGRSGEAVPGQRWLLTTALTQLGPLMDPHAATAAVGDARE